MSKFKTDTLEIAGKVYPIRVIKGHIFAEESLSKVLLNADGTPVDETAEYWDSQIAYYFEDGELSSKPANELWTIYKNL